MLAGGVRGSGVSGVKRVRGGVKKVKRGKEGKEGKEGMVKGKESGNIFERKKVFK